jgi:hypothetical protein
MSWDNFTTPTLPWGVTTCIPGLGLSTSSTLVFSEVGGVKKLTAGATELSNNLAYDGSTGTDIVTGTTVNLSTNFHFRITRNGTTLDCMYDGVIEEGDPLWQAQEGG